MSIPYSGANVNYTFTSDGTRSQLVTQIINCLTGAAGAWAGSAARWTVLSGSGTNQVLKSGVTPNGNWICMNILDPGSGNCAQIKMRDSAGSLISQPFYLLPVNGLVYRIIANPYWFWIWASATTAREWCAGGTLITPSFLSGQITNELGIIQGNSSTDAGTSKANYLASYTNSVGDGNNNAAYYTVLCQASLWDQGLNTNGAGDWQLIEPGPSRGGSTFGYRWHDGTFRASEAALCWGTSSGAAEGTAKGWIPDGMYISDVQAVDANFTGYDSHNWWTVGSYSTVHGSLLVVVP